jgi:phage gpG-like protein
MSNEMATVVRRILTAIRVDVTEEIDRNFMRQGFYNEAWARRRSPGEGPILMRSGALRRSVTSVTSDNSIVFRSSLPYAAIHNEGGEIKVTAKMKRYFRARYYAASGGWGRKTAEGPHRELSDGGFYAMTEKRGRVSDEAEFWRLMALMKEGKTIKIPKRTFIGMSAEVEAEVRGIIERILTEYYGSEWKLTNK